ncbi:hypothetical protein NQZ79_g1186 [Umbelopsis isabellina]|nr:hypothetical protein NQZ79_g1186 [Umbelopsis isabellina]
MSNLFELMVLQAIFVTFVDADDSPHYQQRFGTLNFQQANESLYPACYFQLMSSSNSIQEYYERNIKEAKRYYKAVSLATEWSEIKHRPTKGSSDRIPIVHVFKRREQARTVETFRATYVIDCDDTQKCLDGWESMLDNSESRLLWDSTIEKCNTLKLVDENRKVIHILLKNKWSSNSPRDLILIEDCERTETSLHYISTSLPPSKEQPKEFRPANPYVRANLTLSAINVEAINEKQVKIAVYYQIDLKGWISFSVSAYLSHLILDCLSTMEKHGIPPNITNYGSGIQLLHREYDPHQKQLIIKYKSRIGWKSREHSESEDDDIEDGSQHMGSSMPSIASVPIESDSRDGRKRSISSSLETNTYLSSSMNRGHRGGFMNPGFMLSSSPTSRMRAPFGSLSKSSSFHTGAISASRSTSYLDLSTRFQHTSKADQCPDTSIQIKVIDKKWSSMHPICIEALAANTIAKKLEEATKTLTKNVSAKCYKFSRLQQYLIEVGSSSISGLESEASSEHTGEDIDEESMTGTEENVMVLHIKVGTISSTDGESQEQEIILNDKKVLILEYIGHHTPGRSKSENGPFRGNDYFDVEGDVFGSGMTMHDDFKLPARQVDTSKTTSSVKESRSKLLLDSQPDEQIKRSLPFKEPKPLTDAQENFFNSAISEAVESKDSLSTSVDGYVHIYERQLPDGSKAVVNESNWKNCSLWDVKALIDCPSISYQWSSTYDSGQIIGNLSPRCTVHSAFFRSSWRSSLREYLSVNATYASLNRLRYVSLSFDGLAEDQTVTKQADNGEQIYLLNGWQIDSKDDDSCSVKFLVQKEVSGRPSSHSYNPIDGPPSDIVAKAKKSSDEHEVPPTLAYIINARIKSIQYDKHKGSWRCQYEVTNASNDPLFPIRGSVTYIRLPRNIPLTPARGFNITIDPPCDNLLSVINLPSDKTGIWLRIEHDRNNLIQDGGSILLLVKQIDCKIPVQVNGSVTSQVDFDAYAGAVHFVAQEDLPIQLLEQLQGSLNNGSGTFKVQKQAANASASNHQIIQNNFAINNTKDVSDGLNAKEVQQSSDKRDLFADLSISTYDQAAAACQYLYRMSDQQFGWVHVSEKNGLLTQKRSGGTVPVETLSLDPIPASVTDSLDQQFPIIPEHLMLMKGIKVIEGFSVEEVASVVSDPGHLQQTFRDSLLAVDVLKKLANGHACAKLQMKSWFPFKSRDVYVASTTARDVSTTGQSTRILHATTSICNMNLPAEDVTPLAHLYLSGWILEAVDPYTTTTNHPIPSTRVTYMGCIDLGQNVPAYVSNMATSNLIKGINRVESVLKLNGPPPRLISPIPFLEFRNGELHWSGHGNVFTGDHQIEVEYVQSNQHLIVANTYDRAKLLPHQSETASKEDGSPILKHTPTPSFSSTISKSPLLADRRGSAPGRIPLGVLSNKSKLAQSKEALAMSSSKNKIALLDVVADLKSFPRGYSIEVKFSVQVGHSIDLSDKLTARIEQLDPEPSHLIGSAGSLPPVKHNIKVKLDLDAITKEMTKELYSELHNYKLIFSLNPANEEQLSPRTNKLTISGVLGEDEDKWKGITMINGQEIILGTDTKLASISSLRAASTDAVSNHNIDASEPETSISAVLMNVVSHPALSWLSNLSRVNTPTQIPDRDDAASPTSMIGNDMAQSPVETDGVSRIVTSHIQDISNMVLSPFIPSSPSPDATTTPTDEPMPDWLMSEVDRKINEDSKLAGNTASETQQNIPTPSHSRSHALLRQFAVVFILCILIGILIRSFAILAMDADHEVAINNLLEMNPANIKQIWRMRWFGGWDIEILAVKRR